MKDNFSNKRIVQLHPKVQKAFKDFIQDAEEDLGITLRISQGLRTMEEQNALYEQGRTKPGKVVTKAKAGRSFHNYGLAIDLVVMKGTQVNWEYDMSKLLPFAQKYGIDWGGSWKTFKDYPHFEKTYGYTWRQLLSKYNDADFIAGTKYLNI
jgi:D-alanyl-D-alanine dipeptidase